MTKEEDVKWGLLVKHATEVLGIDLDVQKDNEGQYIIYTNLYEGKDEDADLAEVDKALASLAEEQND